MLEAQLSAVLLQSPRVMEVLRAVRALALADAYVAAGFVRDTYWAYRHAAVHARDQDIDVVFFDPGSSPAADEALAARLAAALPGVRWEVTNQAHVHTWYERYSGVAIARLASTLDGIAMWPEVATCVGVRLREGETLDVAAPHGLEDLLAMRWRPNPCCPDRAAYARRLTEKRIQQTWPRVDVEHEP
jgi:hypothetical protein